MMEVFRESRILRNLGKRLPLAMEGFLAHRRWFGGKARQIRAIEVPDIVPINLGMEIALLTFVRVHYTSGPSETYSVPLIEVKGDAPVHAEAPIVKVHVEGESEPIFLLDALSDHSFLAFLLDATAQGSSFRGERGIVRAVSTSAMPAIWQPSQQPLQPSPMKAEQSNSSVVYGDKFVLKLFRRVEEGTNPDLEIGRFLTERAGFPNIPAVAGYLEYVDDENRLHSLGILQAFVHNRGDAWNFTLDSLAAYYQRAEQAGGETPEAAGDLLSLAEAELPAPVQSTIGAYLDSARLLAKRTAELHLALNCGHGDPDFSPEPFRLSDQEKLCDSALALLSCTFDLLAQRQHALPPKVQRSAQLVLNSKERIAGYFRSITELKLSAMRSRIHGDYHLGQVLYTGDDFMLLDFEGEPARPLSERRAKRSPLQDVAGMLRSFHYVAYVPLLAHASDDEKLRSLGSWARYWHHWVSVAFLREYLMTSGSAPYIPGSSGETEVLLDAYMLDKAIYELGYELNNRPAWAAIPLEGITELLGR